MRKSRLITVLLFGIGLLAFAAWRGLAQEPVASPDNQNPNLQTTPEQTADLQPESGERSLVIESMPAREIIGSIVVNTKGERLGTIDDMLIALDAGKIRYVALLGGGHIGIGDKLFAVPFEEFKTTHNTNNNKVNFVLDAAKELLEKSKGFDKNHWPPAVGKEWRAQLQPND